MGLAVVAAGVLWPSWSCSLRSEGAGLSPWGLGPGRLRSLGPRLGGELPADTRSGVLRSWRTPSCCVGRSTLLQVAHLQPHLSTSETLFHTGRTRRPGQGWTAHLDLGSTHGGAFTPLSGCGTTFPPGQREQSASWHEHRALSAAHSTPSTRKGQGVMGPFHCGGAEPHTASPLGAAPAGHSLVLRRLGLKGSTRGQTSARRWSHGYKWPQLPAECSHWVINPPVPANRLGTPCPLASENPAGLGSRASAAEHRALTAWQARPFR